MGVFSVMFLLLILGGIFFVILVTKAITGSRRVGSMPGMPPYPSDMMLPPIETPAELMAEAAIDVAMFAAADAASRAAFDNSMIQGYGAPDPGNFDPGSNDPGQSFDPGGSFDSGPSFDPGSGGF